MSAPRKVESDVRRRTVLQATLGAAGPTNAAAVAEPSSEEYLDQLEEALNRRVDGDVEALVTGLAELVGLAKTEGKDHFQVAQDAFQAECRTESMIRAAHNLLSLTHTLKLLHLFSDPAVEATNRERESARLEKSIADLKAQLYSSMSM